VIGFGDIGSTCGKVAKNGFGTRVIGVDKYEIKSEQRKACADEIVGLD
jgi:phosphoglycerate dehydrogenase-like enzyme